MADPNDAFSTLDDFLLSLADGITQAQTQLSEVRSTGASGPKFTYHLPRVDFELKLNLTVIEDSVLSSRYKDVRPARDNDKHLLFSPAAVQGGPDSKLDIAAVVRGTFVAVPANEGLPSAVVRTDVVVETPLRARFRITVHNTAGEPLANRPVEINLDRDESRTLNVALGRAFTLHADTRLDRSVIVTNAAGIAETVLTIAPGQYSSLLVFVIDTAGRTETLVYDYQAPLPDITVEAPPPAGGFEFKVRVRDKQGSPIAGAVVEAKIDHAKSQVRTAASGASYKSGGTTVTESTSTDAAGLARITLFPTEDSAIFVIEFKAKGATKVVEFQHYGTTGNSPW